MENPTETQKPTIWKKKALITLWALACVAGILYILFGIFKPLDAAKYSESGSSQSNEFGSFLSYRGQETDMSAEHIGVDVPELCEKYRDIITAFNLLKMPSIKGRKFVIFNIGPTPEGVIMIPQPEPYALGWLLDENEKTILLLENTGKSMRFSSVFGDSKDSGEITYGNMTYPGYGKYMDLGWSDFCNNFIAEGVRSGRCTPIPSGRSIASHVYLAALYGYWALERGDAETALKLFELAEKSLAESQGMREALKNSAGGSPEWKQAVENLEDEPEKPETLIHSVASDITVEMKCHAINSAHNGTSRGELLGMWKKIAVFFGEDNTCEAWVTANAYETMIEEDKNWKEPTQEEFDKMSPQKKAEYWLYHLRDVGAYDAESGEIIMNPGSISSVLYWPGHMDNNSINPARKLLEIGWDAVPLLIEHLDNPRPTRSEGYWRSWWPKGYYILRYGDACREILSGIAGISTYDRSTTSGYVMVEGKESYEKKKAKVWWARVKDKSIEERYVDLLENGKRYERAVGAEYLIKQEREKYAPLVIKALQKSTDEEREHILSLCPDIFTKPDIPMLAGFIKEAEYPERVLKIAQIMWYYFDSEEAPRATLDWIYCFDKDYSFQSDEFLDFFRQFKRDYVIDYVLNLLKSKESCDIRDVCAKAHYFPSRKILDRLLELAENRTETGCVSDGYVERVCDYSISAICKMINYSKEYKMSGNIPFEEREKFYTELKKYIDKNKDNLKFVEWDTTKKTPKEIIEMSR